MEIIFWVLLVKLGLENIPPNNSKDTITVRDYMEDYLVCKVHAR